MAESAAHMVEQVSRPLRMDQGCRKPLWAAAGGWYGAIVTRRRFVIRTSDTSMLSIERRIVVLSIGLLVCSVQGVHAWRVSIDGTSDSPDAANAVAIDPAGDIVAAGSLESDFFVVKLAAATGAQSWRREIDGGPYGSDVANAVVVDASGDVVVVGGAFGEPFIGDHVTVMKLAGSTGNDVWSQDLGPGIGRTVATDGAGDVLVAATHYDADIRVVKLARATGDVLWERVIHGPGMDTPWNFERALAIDGNGDVIVAGSIMNVGTRQDWLVAKLSGITGAEVWRRELDGGNNGMDHAWSVVVDAAGDVMAAGHSVAPMSEGQFVVHKFSGVDGADMWRRVYGLGSARALAFDPTGDLIAGGDVINGVNYSDFAVVRLSAATGTELWHATLGDPVDSLFDSVFAVAVRGDGAVLAAGVTAKQASGDDFTLAAFDGTTGALLWRFDLDGVSSTADEARAVALGNTGDVVAVGVVDDQRMGPTFTVVKVSNGPAAGKLLVVSDRGDPARRVLKFKHTDATLVTASAGGPNDPTIADGAVWLTNPTTGETAMLPLPAANWRARAVPEGTVWEYRDATQLAGPCQNVRIDPRRRITAKCRGAGIAFSLDETVQGSLAIRIETGAMPYCALFGGTIASDRPGIFKAKSAPAPASCS